MIVVSIGDIILWAIGGIALIILGIAYIIDRIGSHKEKKIDDEVENESRSL